MRKLLTKDLNELLGAPTVVQQDLRPLGSHWDAGFDAQQSGLEIRCCCSCGLSHEYCLSPWPGSSICCRAAKNYIKKTKQNKTVTQIDITSKSQDFNPCQCLVSVFLFKFHLCLFIGIMVNICKA